MNVNQPVILSQRFVMNLLVDNTIINTFSVLAIALLSLPVRKKSQALFFLGIVAKPRPIQIRLRKK